MFHIIHHNKQKTFKLLLCRICSKIMYDYCCLKCNIHKNEKTKTALKIVPYSNDRSYLDKLYIKQLQYFLINLCNTVYQIILDQYGTRTLYSNWLYWWWNEKWYISTHIYTIAFNIRKGKTNIKERSANDVKSFQFRRFLQCRVFQRSDPKLVFSTSCCLQNPFSICGMYYQRGEVI